jgi:hypothetical protein
MIEEPSSDKDVSMRDHLKKYFGEVVKGEKIDGHRFSAKLLGIDGDKLIFVTRNGDIRIDNIKEIRCIGIEGGRRGP